MAKLIEKLLTVQVPAHRLRQERRNLMVFATVAAALALVLSWQVISSAAAPAAVAAAPEAPAQARAELPAPALVPAEDVRRHRRIAEHLSRRYLVSADAIEEMVAAAHHAADRVRLDPLLILAVMAVESRFNPVAESVAGAKGLMQVIPKYHPEKFEPLGGEKAVLDPRANILVGALIIREYLNRTGDLTAALQLYNGAPNDPETGYTRKVMAEHQRLKGFVTQMRA